MKIGDKVVCIREYWEDATGKPQPKKDEIYVISAIWKGEELLCENALSGDIYLDFVEFPGECWNRIHFRLLHHDFAENLLSNIKKSTQTTIL